jgi:hypothetical protein
VRSAVPDVGSIDPYQAVIEYPELAPLLALCERADTGWAFTHERRGGEVVAIQGVRHTPGYLDIIRIYSYRRAVVARAPLTGPDAGRLAFHRAGPPADVIPVLLALPEPEA